MNNQPLTVELTDKNIIASFPQIAVADASGKYPTIIYNHRKTVDEDGNEVTRVATCRLAHKLDGQPFLLRKSIVVDESELDQYPLGTQYARDLFLFETTNEEIAGGELAVNQSTGEPFTSGGKPVKRFFLHTGDLLGVNKPIEILPGVFSNSVEYVKPNLTSDMRVGYDARPRARNDQKSGASTNALGSVAGKSKL